MTYREMKELVMQGLQNPTLEGMVPEFIRQGQLLLERKLRIRAMEVFYNGSEQNPVESVAISTNSFALPTGYIELIYFALVDSTTRYPIFDRRSARDMVNVTRNPIIDSTQTGRPLSMSRRANSFVFDRYTNKAYDFEIGYFAHLSTLTEDSDTNWWTTDASDALMYASLFCAIPVLPAIEVKNGLIIDPRVSLWKGLLSDHLSELQRSDSRERLSGAPKRTRYSD